MDSDRDDSSGPPSSSSNHQPTKQPPAANNKRGNTSSFLRPTAQRALRRRAPPHSKERFEAEALGGRLWHPTCQHLARDDFTGEQIPLEFSSVDEYIATFDPLVLEEAREGLKAAWSENCAAGRVWRAEVMGIDQLANGWSNVRLRVHGREEEARLQCGPATSVVLTLGRPPQRSAAEWLAAQLCTSPSVVANVSKKRSRVDQLKMTMKGGDDDDTDDDDATMSGADEIGATVDIEQQAPPSSTAAAAAAALNNNEGKVIAGLVTRGGGGNSNSNSNSSRDIVIKVHPCCTAHYSYTSSDADKNDDDAPPPPPCCACVVQNLRRFSQAWWLVPAGMLITSEREFDAVHAVRTVDGELMRHVLKPKLLADIGKLYESDEVRRKMWPGQARHPAFVQRLKQDYDYKQLEAIEMTACHLGAPDAPPSQLSARLAASSSSSAQRQQHHQQPPTAAPTTAALPKLSFVLIQGPPGTGKTHTVRGVLNVWHLVAFQKYYSSLIQQVLPGGLHSTSSTPSSVNSVNAHFDMLAAGAAASARLGAAVRASKPRILICTPSNAACDELMSRIMSLGFFDGDGKRYFPNVVRVGAAESVVAAAVRARSLKALVTTYKDMTQAEWQRQCADIGQRLGAANREVGSLEVALGRCASGSGEALSTAQRLVSRVQAAFRLRSDMDKLDAAKDLVWGRREDGRAHRAESELETRFLMDAEMVFATLSSTQRKIFKVVAAKAPFHTVLIDEAGQSSEVAALQPLAFGARQVVLVGDPQQLPATILSAAAKSVAMERSLFERLQCQGCPVVLLTVQYRMHPEIRSFPSRHFYQDKLEDAPTVTALPSETYHSQPMFKPYLVFDVARGKERRKQGGGSLSNAAEAEMAACLFASLRNFIKQSTTSGVTPLPPPPPSVAVITPYREQRQLLRNVFTAVHGSAEVLKHVAIETVDSYQGRQVDIVIVSCVRAAVAGGGGLGFVNDVRRMNVAITRARRSLWILGSGATLKGNVEWAALLGDAEQRGVLVHDAHAETLFPDLEYWQRIGGGGIGGVHVEKQQQQQQQHSAGGGGVEIGIEQQKNENGGGGDSLAHFNTLEGIDRGVLVEARGVVERHHAPPPPLAAAAAAQLHMIEDRDRGVLPKASVKHQAATATAKLAEELKETEEELKEMMAIDLTGESDLDDDDDDGGDDDNSPVAQGERKRTRSAGGGARKPPVSSPSSTASRGRGGGGGRGRGRGGGGRRERSISPPPYIPPSNQKQKPTAPSSQYPMLPTRR